MELNKIKNTNNNDNFKFPNKKDYIDFREDFKKNSVKEKIEVYIHGEIRYISKEDFIKYVKVKELPKEVSTIGDIEIVPIEPEKIDEICELYNLSPEYYLLRVREREQEKEKENKRPPNDPHEMEMEL